MPVILDHDTHTYTNTENKDVYTSVTTFISQYKKPFDKEFWSKHVAKKEGIDPSVVLETWNSLTKTAQGRGTKIHLVMERFIKDRYVESGYEELADSFFKKTSHIINSTAEVLSEELLYDHEHKLAGTADLIIDCGNIFHILDFKTNKKFNFTSKYNEYFYKPVDYLQQCEFNTYTLQLSIYAYMYEQITGKRCGGLKIFYLRESSGKYWQEINCSYMKSAVRDMLQDKQEKYLETI